MGSAAYRLPREPSTPRITVWRRLRRLGAVQIVDGLVALPRDGRTQEQLEWLADEILEANGEATIWFATPGSAAQERALAQGMAAVVAAEYQAVTDAAEAAREKDGAVRRRTLHVFAGRCRRSERETSFRHPSASAPSGRSPSRTDPEIFLAAHAGFFDLAAKRARSQQAGAAANPGRADATIAGRIPSEVSSAAEEGCTRWSAPHHQLRYPIPATGASVMPDASRLAMAGLVLATLAPTSVAAAPEGRFEKSLSVSGPVTLSVTSGSGSIKISSGADGTVRVIGTVRGNSGSGAGSDDEVTRAVKAVETSPPIVQQGNTIKLGTIDDEAISRRVSVSFEVTVPRTTSVTARTGSGSQDIASLAGSVSAHTGSGAITIGAVEGAVEARSGSGRVEVAAGKERVSIATGSGEVKVGPRRRHGLDPNRQRLHLRRAGVRRLGGRCDRLGIRLPSTA